MMEASQEVALSDLIPNSYSLSELSVYNWGSFNRLHRISIDKDGTAIIGPTGSGKTTLVDAFMTLICAQPKYNLASTGGHESDRDLMSYVRGVSGAGNDSDSIDHIARTGKTVTAIEACFENGSQSVRMAVVLWIDSSSNSMSDLKRAWMFSELIGYGIDEWLAERQEGGMRALKQLGRDKAGIHVSDNKKSYLAQLRRFFDVSENAFTLLNRAAGLKQINSIDDLFRELVLDDCSAFSRAAEVASEFDDLSAIHSELEIARQQKQSLEPISTEYNKLLTHRGEVNKLHILQAILPVWYALHGYRLWSDKETRISEDLEIREDKSNILERNISTTEKQTEALHAIYMESGGASIELLAQQIFSHEEKYETCKKSAEEYQKISTALGLNGILSKEIVRANQAKATELFAEKKADLDRVLDERFKFGAVSNNFQDTIGELKREIAKISESRSNVPGKYLEFREELSAALGVSLEIFPYVGELVEVKADESEWRGAIERAVGGHRLRMLVPEEYMRQASSWVNNRHNRLHVRLLKVEKSYRQASFFADGFTRKLTFKKHPCREAVKYLLAGIDRHCVASVDQLQKTPYGMTAQGLMSGKSGFFDKQDQRRLDEDWMTGFDNRDRLGSLNVQLDSAQEKLDANERVLEIVKQKHSQLEKELGLLDKVVQKNFTDIDMYGQEKVLEAMKSRLEDARSPDSDIGKTEKNWKDSKNELEALRKNKAILDGEIGALRNEIAGAKKNSQRNFHRIGGGLTDEDQQLANSTFEVPTLSNIDDQERESAEQLRVQTEEMAGRVSNCESNLGRFMEKAQRADTGAMAEMGTELEDIPAYLERLRVLTEEDLPEKQSRFLEYLNQSSDQGVTQLLMTITSEVDKISERIEELNHTMRCVDYQPGRYIRLDPKPVLHESLNTLTKAQQHLRYATTLDDSGESHYNALQNVVEILRDASERKRTKGAQALLDPRYRLEFSVSVIERSSGSVIETRKGSQGGSGGEKEIIASYILTASLSYALCPDGSSKPLFGTVVLDEAFSRSSQAVAGRIISALREFGLHPLFITPNKEIKLLRSHTRSAVLVHNKGMNSTATCLSWEQLDKQADKYRSKSHEVSGRIER